MPVAEDAPRTPQLTGELLLRQRVDDRAVLLEERVEQGVDRLRPMRRRHYVAAAKRRDLVDLLAQPLLRGGLRLEAALVAADAVLVVVASSVVPLAALHDASGLLLRHRRSFPLFAALPL